MISTMLFTKLFWLKISSGQAVTSQHLHCFEDIQIKVWNLPVSALKQFSPTECSIYPSRRSPEVQWIGAKPCTTAWQNLALRHNLCPVTWTSCSPLWRLCNHYTQQWPGVLLKKMLQVITSKCKQGWEKTYLQVTAGHEKSHPPDCSRPERGTFFMSICYIPWYKIHNCFGLMYRTWLGVKHLQEWKWLVLR